MDVILTMRVLRPWFADMSKAVTPDEAAVDLIWLLQNRFKKFHGVLVKN